MTSGLAYQLLGKTLKQRNKNETKSEGKHDQTSILRLVLVILIMLIRVAEEYECYSFITFSVMKINAGFYPLILTR